MYWKMRNEKSVFEFSKFYSLQSEGNLFHCYSKIWQVLEGDLGRLILVLVVCLYREFGLVYSVERGLRMVQLYLARIVVIVLCSSGQFRHTTSVRKKERNMRRYTTATSTEPSSETVTDRCLRLILLSVIGITSRPNMLTPLLI
ncbi:hypothetical protein HanXRQr2_Chr01g0006661 [Helianthus annuus]|uniref:Uncharacterized protein n=1 Tax=Helianthus annuus TaxID=4232 RepID=A0A9K3JSY2_HELAN|nr:hypothetical protein HanXRQr2_Chr01g0006661 [Helianthus annuus]